KRTPCHSERSEESMFFLQMHRCLASPPQRANTRRAGDRGSLGMTPFWSLFFSALPALMFYNFSPRNLNEFEITDTELKLIAAAARIGLSSSPKNGYSTPAATGTPSEL